MLVCERGEHSSIKAGLHNRYRDDLTRGIGRVAKNVATGEGVNDAQDGVGRFHGAGGVMWQ